MAFKGKPPASGSGEMSTRTRALRPRIPLTTREMQEARRLRRLGHEPEQIAEHLAKDPADVEKALLQMRMPRPETTRGTLNVTLAAHRLVLRERRAGEPVWVTFDRMLDELLRLRDAAAERGEGEAPPARRRPAGRPHGRPAGHKGPDLPLLPGLAP